MPNAAVHGLPMMSQPAPSLNPAGVNHHPQSVSLPQYRGRQWIRACLPDGGESWSAETGGSRSDRSHEPVTCSPWRWPAEPVFFFGDPHADSEAFMASLVASGGIEKTSYSDDAFCLTDAGRKALFVLAGDCFDKGPDNLRLMRTLRLLLERGARMRILAGNHDVRILLGMREVKQPRNPRNEHFFIRMGAKAVPFLVEIHNQYLTGREALRGIPGTAECRRRLYPSDRWFDIFPELARKTMQEQALERELIRIRWKIDHFQEDCDAAGLTLRHAYAAALKWQSLFLRPEGEFFWFFRMMQLAYQEGSFLFIHAGLDDRIAEAIDKRGLRYLNRRFREQLDGEAFDLYYGPLANCFRTKYREVDLPFTRQGASSAHHAGIQVVLHGHRNVLQGQHIVHRQGMINFECDTTMDVNSRREEGLKGPGAGVTIIHPDGMVMGISTDHQKIKLYSQDVDAPCFSL